MEKVTITTDNGAGNAAAPHFTIDTAAFLRAAAAHDCNFEARSGLFRAIYGRATSGTASPDLEKVAHIDQQPDFPAAIDYFALAREVNGTLALQALECAQANIGAARDYLSHMIARNFILPLIEDEAAELHGAAVEVVNLFTDWRLGKCRAEVYGAAALRLRFDRAYKHADGTDAVTHLIEALGSDGVDWYGYHGGACPGGQWRAFGEYLARASIPGYVVEDLRLELGDDDPELGEGGDPALQWWNETLDARLTAVGRRALADREDEIKALIYTALALYPAK